MDKKELTIIQDVLIAQQKFIDDIYEKSVCNFLKEKGVYSSEVETLYSDMLYILSKSFDEANDLLYYACVRLNIELD